MTNQIENDCDRCKSAKGMFEYGFMYKYPIDMDMMNESIKKQYLEEKSKVKCFEHLNNQS